MGTSWTDGNGTTHHYDDYGRETGTSYTDYSGTTHHHDAYGHDVGTSYTDYSGTTHHHDAYGRDVGTSYKDFSGTTHHHDEYGREIGTSYKDLSGTTHYHDAYGRDSDYMGRYGSSTDNDLPMSYSYSYSVGSSGGKIKFYEERFFPFLISSALLFAYLIIFQHIFAPLIFPAILIGVGIALLQYDDKKRNKYDGPKILLVNGMWIMAWTYTSDAITKRIIIHPESKTALFNFGGRLALIIIIAILWFCIFMSLEDTLSHPDPYTVITFMISLLAFVYGFYGSVTLNSSCKFYHSFALLAFGAIAVLDALRIKIFHND